MTATARNLERFIMQQQQFDTSVNDNKLFASLRGIPFWIWDEDKHAQAYKKTNGKCCFNDIIGRPKDKHNVEKPLYDYQKLLYFKLFQNEEPDFKNKHLWVKKATNLGITEFFLRILVWLCLRNDDYKGSQAVILTGPNISLAVGLVKRIKAYFEPHDITFDTKETTIELNGITISAYPSNHLDSVRSLTRPFFILLDEGDFLRKGEQEDARHISERYIGKSDPFLILVSTPNAPRNLFQRIEQEPEDLCIYKRIKLDYTWGVGKIYDDKDIEKAMKSPSWKREYCLQYQGLIGNVYHTSHIEQATNQQQYDPDNINHFTVKFLSCDPGWGSSATGICVTQLNNDKIEVLYAEEFERPDFNQMIDLMFSLIQKYQPTKIAIDGSQNSFIRSLKIKIGEDPEYEKAIAFYKSNHRNYENNMRILPINFGVEHKQMLSHTKLLLESGSVCIDKRFDKLLTALRTAVENEGKLDKNVTSFNDVYDAWRMSMYMYQYNSVR